MFFIILLLLRLFFFFISSFLFLIVLFIILYPAPPTNQSTYRKWTIGPIYYSALVTAEALDPSNITQIVDPTQQRQHLPIQFTKVPVVPWGEYCYSTMLAIRVVQVI